MEIGKRHNTGTTVPWVPKSHAMKSRTKLMNGKRSSVATLADFGGKRSLSMGKMGVHTF